jgi:PAP2 superfamily
LSTQFRDAPAIAAVATHNTTHQVVHRYRLLSVVLLIASMAISTSLALISQIRVESSGTAVLASTLACFLLVSALWWTSAEKSQAADVLGALSVVSLSGPSCGAMALLGLRLHFPLADSVFMSFDHLLGVDGIAIVRLMSTQGYWLFGLMSAAYHYTLPMIGLTIVALALIGERREAWRIVLCFVGSLLTVCVFATFAPAKGLGTWTSDPLLARLPGCSMRCFWPVFDAFYAGDDPVLGLKNIDGVISFPSFHAVMGCIVVAAWRKRPLTLFLASIWFIFMLLGTIPYGGHYIVDLFGGIAVWGTWFAISCYIERQPFRAAVVART